MHFVTTSLDSNFYFEEFDFQVCPSINKTRFRPKQRKRRTVKIPNAKSSFTTIENQLYHLTLPGKEYVLEYLKKLYLKNRSPNTISGNGRNIISFLIFIKNNGKEYIELITRDDLWAFVEHEQDRGLKPLSVETKIRSINAFTAFLIEQNVVHPDVLKKTLKVYTPDPLPRAMEPKDVDNLYTLITNCRDRALLLTLLRTGMRIGELLNTKMVDLNIKEKRIEIYEAQKNRTGRIVYISDDAVTALTSWVMERDSSEEYLFYSCSRNMLGYEAARSMFRKYIDKAGLRNKGYTLHCLRHTFASELLNAGMRLECLQTLLGHSSVEMTRRYARLTDTSRKKEYFKAMSLIEKGGIRGHYRFDHKLS